MIHNLLVVPYYKDKHPERQEELDFCLSLNCKTFDAVCVVSQEEPQPDWFFGENLFWFVIPTKQLIGDLVDRANSLLIKELNCDANIVIVLANTDIIIDFRALDLIKRNLKKREVYCLARHELKNQKLWDVDYAQDVWAFRGPISETMDRYIPLAQPGFDNRLTHEFNRIGYELRNPSKDIKVYHNHQTLVVTQFNAQKYRLPLPYLFISPHHLGETPILREATKLPSNCIRDRERKKAKVRR